MARARTLIVGIALAASLAGNVVLARRYDQLRSPAQPLEQREPLEPRPQPDAAYREDVDVLMELIPAITQGVGLEDLEAYLKSVYSGEQVGVTEDPKCIGCVVVAWRSFRFAFDETGQLARVALAP